MADLDWTGFSALAALCLVAAFAALWLFARMTPRHRGGKAEDAVAYLFDGEEIVQASDQGALVLHEIGSNAQQDWHLLYIAFKSRFPDLPATAQDARAMAPRQIASAIPEDTARLDLSEIRGRLRISLDDTQSTSMTDKHLRIVQRERLRSMADMANLFPYPIWLRAKNGEFDWANTAYFDLLKQISTPAESAARDPAIPAFEIGLSSGDGRISQRVMVEEAGSEATRWYSVTNSETDTGALFGFAIGIDAVIEAEIAQRKFVQTLTKTFAQLSTGLAIFDRDRQLALFNPALVDLLDLPVDFLSSRPTLNTFFDRLRDSRMMPEPKDYANWRQQITELVIASVDGRFHETWTLPSGLTYRVTGRPHPDGAIALLFEDISAEISLTRRFRWQLNLGQSLIDTLDEAIAVFTSTGTLSISNKAFRTLWKIDPDTSFAEFTLRDALNRWKHMATPGPFWTKLRSYMDNPADRTEWFSDISMKDGTGVECRVAPLSGGATLVGFRLRPVMEKAAAQA